MKWDHLLLPLLALTFQAESVHAADPALWGSATEIAQTYNGQKVVFDTTSGTTAGLSSVLDRASLISVLNGADPLEQEEGFARRHGALWVPG